MCIRDRIKGIGSDIPTFSLTALKVEKPKTYDVIVGMYTQIVSMSNMAYRPNLVLMHPLDYAQIDVYKRQRYSRSVRSRLYPCRQEDFGMSCSAR